MNSVDRIEALIVKGAEGFFDEQDIREDLHVTIRIAMDFYEFLVGAPERPSAEAVSYVMDTVRSGMDQFFGLAYLCRVIADSGTWHFDRQVHWGFEEMREAYFRHFRDLTRDEVSTTERLASLLMLTHLELVFLGQGFPWGEL
jgi:hypothetical protein